ncbi:uncharacterized protein [Elaeis guineensis]|uniref:Coenzyme Q-binding protein COQ10 homolog, mitochondrial isoform X1 n=1 Tax=Elaeis guineensis var. tenera TaxID=51953 RepID=A0A6I9R043_ELAGV|nr:coenzyme Q-binding protein COQ10 homolog, mitochondrial isoform X1 [Elaeis guineensis]
MPPVVSPLKALARLSSRGQHGLGPNKYGLASWRRCVEGGRRLERFAPTRSLRSVVRLGNPCIDKLVDADKVFCNSFRDSYSSAQTRWFLGCGDGEEGNVLSKTHEERRVMGYSPEQLFGVVAAVDLYEDFLPWCQHSRIIRRNNDGSFDAELEIGFKFLVESYISHVELEKPKSIKTTVSESGLFEYLINIWEFNPGPVPGSCDLYFLVDFKFQSPLYRQVALMFFKEVVSRLVDSFSDRCRRIYGPGIRVSERPYGQGL